MALGGFGPQRRTTILATSGSGVGVIIDATVSEEHNISVQTTDHPVERGFAVTDHRRVQPRVIKLTGIISNYPVKLFASAGGAKDEVTAAWRVFNQLKDSGELVTVATSLATYENMMITDISVPRDAKRGNVLEFSVTCKEIRIVDSEEVIAPTIEEPVQEQPKPPEKNLGLKTPVPPAAATLKSASASLVDKGVSGIAGSVRELLPIN